MLRKFILTAVVLSSTSFAYATHPETSLTITPKAPSTWGYIASWAVVNNYFRMTIGDGITIPVETGDYVFLDVTAMNVKPKLSESCSNIQIKTEGKHQLLFDLQKDWLIHCEYS